MDHFLYRMKSSLYCSKLLNVCFWAFIFNLVTSPVFAQVQRRGLFLQDQVLGQQGPENFGERDEDLLDGGQDDNLSSGSRRKSDSFSDRTLIYQIHVLGEVKRPGTYRVSPSMRVTDALQLSGNLKPMGSERFIQLRKLGQKKGAVLDLFAYKTFGEISQNPYLQDNDTIYVPLKKRAIEIEGPVRRPGVFELKGEDSLEDILELAGGFTVGVDSRETIKVVRFSSAEDKEVIPITQDSVGLRAFKVRDGDVIIIPHKFLVNREFDYNLKQLPNDNIFYPAHENRVFVIGAVRAPGAFDFNQHYSLRQYLTVAGGTTTMAKNRQIKVVAVDGKTYKAKNGNYDRYINPGDTIVVPEKSIPTSFYIGLLPTIASLGLSAAALFK